MSEHSLLVNISVDNITSQRTVRRRGHTITDIEMLSSWRKKTLQTLFEKELSNDNECYMYENENKDVPFSVLLYWRVGY